MAPHSSTLAWKIPWTEETGRLQSMELLKGRTRLSDFTFTFHFHALEKEMATHSSVLAWRILGMGEPGGLPSVGLHRVGHDWSDLAAAAATSSPTTTYQCPLSSGFLSYHWNNSFLYHCISWYHSLLQETVSSLGSVCIISNLSDVFHMPPLQDYLLNSTLLKHHHYLSICITCFLR